MTDNFLIKNLKRMVEFVSPDLKLNDGRVYTSFKDIYLKHRYAFFLNHFLFVIEKIIGIILPVVLAYAFNLEDIWGVLLVLGVYFLGHPVIGFATEYINVVILGRIFQSIGLQANKFFLSTDPINHSNKSSGEVISKTNRLMKSFEGFNDKINYDLIGKVLSSIVAIFYAFSIDFWLGIICFISLISLLIIGLFVQIKIVKGINSDYIKSEDKVIKNLVENINGFNLIRASFGVQERYVKSKNVYNEMKWQFNFYHLGRTIIWTVIRFLAAISALIIIYYLYSLYLDGQISIATLLASTFVSLDAINNSKGLGRVYSDILKYYLDVKDFYKFKENFGKQTYKVLK